MSIPTIPSETYETVCIRNDIPAKVSTDHTYSSPTPKLMQGSSLEAKPAGDHTFAEHSDTPTEPYGSDTEHTLDSVSTGITKEGWLIGASTNRLEISVEYSSSATLLEATGTSQNASEMLLDVSNAGIVKASPDKSELAPLPDKTTNHEALLEATTAPEPQNGSLPDETQRLLPDEPADVNKMLQEATNNSDVQLPDKTPGPPNGALPDETQQLLPDELNQTSPVCSDVNKMLQEATNHLNVQLSDKTPNVLSDDMRPNITGLPDDTAATNSSRELLDTLEDLPLKGKDQPEQDGSITGQNNTLTDNTNQGSVPSETPDNTTSDSTNFLVEPDKTKSAKTSTESEANSDVAANPRQNDETMSANKSLPVLPLSEAENSEEQTETTTEQVIGKISYMECSDDLQSVKSSSEIPNNFIPVETSSVVSELPEFSHTPDTTVTIM